MSFGYTTRDNGYILIEEAIDYAQSKGVLLFAAASNSGANQRRTFPARHDNVICIHSTAADGVPSRFNPPPDCNDNFATIGEAVESAWPSELCDKEVNDCCVAWKSGTSYATPIAAGIAAFLLQYAAENLDEADVRLLKRPRGLRAVFREISLGSQGYDYVAPTVHPGHLFGRDKDYVRQRISVILNES